MSLQLTDQDQITQLKAQVAQLQNEAASPMAAKKVFVNLLKEVPATTVVWKSMSGNFTAKDIIDMLLSDNQDKVDIGTQYVLDWFRLSRDILQARV